MNSCGIVFSLVVLAFSPSSTKPMGSTDNFWDTFENDVDGAYHKVSTLAVHTYRDVADSNLGHQTADAVTSAGTVVSHAATSAYDALSESATKSKTMLVSGYSSAAKTVSEAASTTKEFAVEAYSKVESEISEASNNTATFFETAWGKVSSGFTSFTSSIKDFCSSSWNKVQTWWTELEDDVKEFIHFVLKIVDIVIGAFILGVIGWIFYKARQTWNVVERHTSVPTTL